MPRDFIFQEALQVVKAELLLNIASELRDSATHIGDIGLEAESRI